MFGLSNNELIIVLLCFIVGYLIKDMMKCDVVENFCSINEIAIKAEMPSYLSESTRNSRTL